MLEALFGLSRKAVENEPLKIFMAMSDLDRNRATPAGSRDRRPAGALLEGVWRQYAIFNDSPALKDATILAFLDTAVAIDKIKDTLLRQNTAGTMQALVGLWQIFCRQGLIAQGQEDKTLSCDCCSRFRRWPASASCSIAAAPA